MGINPEDVNTNEGPSEYSWGAGMFPPGIAQNENQRKSQADFGAGYPNLVSVIGDNDDNYARMVADKRTDTTDSTSNRDFNELGNCDRYGAAPALIQDNTVPNINQRKEIRPTQTPRRA